MVAFFRLSHPENASWTRPNKLFGNVISVSASQLLNEFSPIVSSDASCAEMLTFDKCVHPAKDKNEICVMLFGMAMDDSAVQPRNDSPLSWLTPSFSVTAARAVHPLNAATPTVDTLPGTLTEVSAMQFLNAPSEISCNPEGSVTEDK